MDSKLCAKRRIIAIYTIIQNKKQLYFVYVSLFDICKNVRNIRNIEKFYLI